MGAPSRDLSPFANSRHTGTDRRRESILRRRGINRLSQLDVGRTDRCAQDCGDRIPIAFLDLNRLVQCGEQCARKSVRHDPKPKYSNRRKFQSDNDKPIAMALIAYYRPLDARLRSTDKPKPRANPRILEAEPAIRKPRPPRHLVADSTQVVNVAVEQQKPSQRDGFG
jgi:hypothetical protein